MIQAALAILSNKLLHDMLHKEEGWICNSEQALEFVCSTMLDIDILKAIVAICGKKGANKLSLNGSVAFAYAIRNSSAECAQIIVDNTEIIMKEYYIGTYLSYLEESSLDFDLFIQWFENHEQGTEIKQKLLAQQLQNCQPCKGIQNLKLLRARGADLLHMNENNFNALHVVCQSPHLYKDVLEYLVNIGISLSQESSKGEVPLMIALENYPRESIIRWLLPISPNKHKTKDGEGYFHFLMRSLCSFQKLTPLCKMILNNDEDINLQDASGRTPVMHLIRSFCHLRFHGAVKNKQFKFFLQSVPLNMHITNNDGQNVLHHLFEDKSISASEIRVEKLKDMYDFLRRKFKVDDQLEDKNGISPHMLASQWFNKPTSNEETMNRMDVLSDSLR